MLKEDESIERKIDRREIVYRDDYVIFGYGDEETDNKLNKFFYKHTGSYMHNIRVKDLINKYEAI